MIKRSGFVLVMILAVGLSGYLSRPTQAQTQGTAGQVTLADVVTEIRQLRVVTEENGKQQLLASMLGAQQGRIQPVSNRLFDTRKEIEEADRNLRAATTSLQAWQASSASTPGSAQNLAIAKRAYQDAGDKMAALRARESDLSSELQREEAAWSDLIAQLQRLIRK